MRMRGRNPHACVRTCQHTTMSFRGRGGGRGGGRGRGGRGRGGGRGGRFQHYDYGPPEYVTEVGSFVHPCEEDLVCKGSIEKVPYFNAPIYLENKSQIGKVDEIFGPMNSYVIHFCREKLFRDSLVSFLPAVLFCEAAPRHESYLVQIGTKSMET
ncbi:H/ACA ribonucleoprotein complex subunit GAR1 [Geodia barretti]|uniref:H/ACA ribonucleoprotein complex subunit n=1 Tax=Geodia barretti TaxID=519541 RepID=A0AA35RLT6_GEOBA|nr:H/ACA ribonucleoprotein complex subunit GAR1 [Geodia barretti]